MAEPSLSEISNIAADPERGGEVPVPVINNLQGLAALNQAAQYKAENDWRKYTNFLQRFDAFSKDMKEVAAHPVATQDRAFLQKKAAGILEKVMQDPRAALAGAGMYELQDNLAGLVSDATESKTNKAFDTAHRAFLYANPELDTEENKAKIQDYLEKQTLGQRKPYMLDLPVVFDMASYVKQGLELPGVKTPFARTGVTPDNQNIFDEEGDTYDPKKFMDYWMGAIDIKQDKQGHPVGKSIERMYMLLPQSEKDKYPNMKDWWREQGKLFAPNAGEVLRKRDLKANPNYLEKEKLDEKIRASRADERQKANELAERIRARKDANYLARLKIKPKTVEENREVFDRPLTSVQYIQGAAGDMKAGDVIDINEPNIVSAFTTAKGSMPSSVKLKKAEDGSLSFEVTSEGTGSGSSTVTSKYKFTDFVKRIPEGYDISPAEGLQEQVGQYYREVVGNAYDEYGNLKSDVEKRPSLFPKLGDIFKKKDSKTTVKKEDDPLGLF